MLRQLLKGQAFDLDVHLAGGDALRAGHLEVHVAEVVLVTEDIRKHNVLPRIFVGDQSHRDADTARLIGTPPSIRARVPAHTVAMDDEPLDSRISLTKRMVYGQSSTGGSIGFRARSAKLPCPTSRRLVPRSGRSSGGERREVVVEQELLVLANNAPSINCSSSPWCRA